MTSTIYSDGTISVANGSTTVTGTGTAWLTAFPSGGLVNATLHAGGSTAIASSADAEGTLTLRRAWLGPTLSGAPYDLVLESSVAASTVVASRQMADITARLLLGVALTQYDQSGTLAERTAYDDAAKGYRYARTDDPSGDLVVYIKASATSGDWVGPFAWRGPKGEDGTPASLPSNLVTSSDLSVADIVTLTQAEYDALGAPDATTLYIIKE